MPRLSPSPSVDAPNLVIIVRDGVLNQYKEEHIKSPEEFEPIPGALEAVSRMCHAGFHVVMATNQPGLGQGVLDMTTLNAVHLHMNQLLQRMGGRIDGVFLCPHTPAEQCECRKPAPGLLKLIGERFGTDLADVAVVGDTVRDLQAAQAAGCEPHLLLTGRSQDLPQAQAEHMVSGIPGARVHADLASFAQDLIARHAPARASSH